MMKLRSHACVPAVLATLLVLVTGTAGAGSITGTVRYEGVVPNLKSIDMAADPKCAEKHDSPPKSEVLVLGEGNTMGNVFVQVKSGMPAKDYPAPDEAVIVDQHGCRYVPHVLGVMAGQPVKIRNSDGILHNVHTLPDKNKGFNRAMPAAVKEAETSFDQQEFMFKVKCDVHPWMSAYIAVMTHPYFDVTEPDGKFTIDGLPAGTYEIEAWHEKLKTRTATVTLGEGETKSVDFSFSPPQRK